MINPFLLLREINNHFYSLSIMLNKKRTVIVDNIERPGVKMIASKKNYYLHNFVIKLESKMRTINYQIDNSNYQFYVPARNSNPKIAVISGVKDITLFDKLNKKNHLHNYNALVIFDQYKMKGNNFTELMMNMEEHYKKFHQLNIAKTICSIPCILISKNKTIMNNDMINVDNIWSNLFHHNSQMQCGSSLMVFDSDIEADDNIEFIYLFTKDYQTKIKNNDKLVILISGFKAGMLITDNIYRCLTGPISDKPMSFFKKISYMFSDYKIHKLGGDRIMNKNNWMHIIDNEVCWFTSNRYSKRILH